nr:MAG TPA: hypothetical protein [Caudoviricetes sp.]DAL11666.1 MAG TPA_asm: hypothetical protein [Caudoviricetes sp.]DAL20855.1 MAG TPA_asm: hypothetical protein [Bacteriophage sp.]
MAQHRGIPVLLPGKKARRRYYLHSLAQYLINSLIHPGNGDAGGLFLASIVSGSHKRMCRHVRGAQLNESPVKGVSRVIRLHRVIAVSGAQVNATNMDAGRNLPAAAAFLGNNHHVFFQFSGAYRCTCDHFVLKHLRTGARGITKNLIVFSAAKRLQILCDVIQAGKIEARLNHFSIPCLQRISS